MPINYSWETLLKNIKNLNKPAQVELENGPKMFTPSGTPNLNITNTLDNNFTIPGNNGVENYNMFNSPDIHMNFEHILMSQILGSAGQALANNSSNGSAQAIKNFNKQQFTPLNYLPENSNTSQQALYGMEDGGDVKPKGRPTLAEISKMPDRNRYEPSQTVKNIKSALAAGSAIPNPAIALPAAGLSAVADAATSLNYYLDGNTEKALEDIAQAGISLLPGTKAVMGMKGAYKASRPVVKGIKLASDTKTVGDNKMSDPSIVRGHIDWANEPGYKSRNASDNTSINRMPDYVPPARGEAAPYIGREEPTFSPAEKVWQSFFKNGDNAGPINKKEDGGDVGDPTKPSKPTMADSLALYNNNNKVIDFYRKNGYSERKDNTSFKEYLKSVDRAKQIVEWNEEAGNHFFVIKDNKYTNDYSYKLKDQYQQIDNNKFYSRESAPNPANINAPMQLIDKRIAPIGMRYFHKNFSEKYDELRGIEKLSRDDISSVAQYDPILIKPVSMLTDEEKQIRYKRYGNKSGIANPNPPIPPFQHLNGETIPIPDQQFPIGNTPQIISGRLLEPRVDGDYSANFRTNETSQSLESKKFPNKARFEEFIKAMRDNGRVPESTTFSNNYGSALYNNKFEEGGEYNLSNEEIANLKKLGYDIEIL